MILNSLTTTGDKFSKEHHTVRHTIFHSGIVATSASYSCMVLSTVTLMLAKTGLILYINSSYQWMDRECWCVNKNKPLSDSISVVKLE